MRTRCVRSIASILALAMAFMAWGPAVALAATPPVFTTRSLITGSSFQANPRMDGNLVVSQVSYPLVPGSDTDVVVHNLHSGDTTSILAPDAFDQSDPDVSGWWIVYVTNSSGNSDIRRLPFGGSFEYPIATTAAEETMPRIDGNLIAWHNGSDGKVHHNGPGGVVPDSANVTHLDVDNGRIFWSDAFVSQNVYVFEPGIDTASQLVYTAPSGTDIDSLNAHGDWFAVTLDSGGVTSAVAERINSESAFGGSGFAPSPFSNTMAFGIGATPSNVSWRAMDIMGPTTVADSTDHESRPSLFGRRVAYERWTSPLNSDIYLAEAPPEVVRTQGADRYATAVEVSKAYYPTAETAVICTGRNFPDALAAVPLARAIHGPLLLVDTFSITSGTLAELDRLGVNKCYVIGGTDVVSPSVTAKLVGEGIAIERLAGADRYATSVAIATEMDTIVEPSHTFGGAFFANGASFPDALALGPVAASKGWPILLVQKDSIPPSVDDFITAQMDEGGAVAGGEDVVSEYVLDRIVTAMGMAPPVYRFAGADRYATSVACINGGSTIGWIDADTVGVATGANFPDALGGGAAMGAYGSGLVLVGGTSLPTSVGNWLSANKYLVGRVDVFGGSDVVSDGVKNAVAAKLQ